jgi:hypothetical protein
MPRGEVTISEPPVVVTVGFQVSEMALRKRPLWSLVRQKSEALLPVADATIESERRRNERGCQRARLVKIVHENTLVDAPASLAAAIA